MPTLLASLIRTTLLCPVLLLVLACAQETPGERQAAPDLFDSPATETTAPDTELVIGDEAPTVAFVGDSIGAGLHLAEHQAFPAVLQARLVERDMPFALVNASESGRTSAGGASAMDWIMRSKPDVVVIELGGNDGLRGIAIEQIEENLRSMISTAREGGARVLLLGVLMPPNYGEYGARFDALYPALAEELKVAFVPYWMEGVGGVPEMNLEDGLHPTAEGHERLADNVLDALVPLLQ